MTAAENLAGKPPDGTLPQTSGPDLTPIPVFIRTAIPEQVAPEELYLSLLSVPKMKIPVDLNQEGVSGPIGEEKGSFMEKRVRDIVSLHPKVKKVVSHLKEDPQDSKGHDMTVFFTEDSGIEPIHIQVKSRKENISNYRNRLSQKLRKLGSKMTAPEWLILDRTITLNGALENEQEILYKFLLGVRKILKQYDELRMKYQWIDLFPTPAAT